MKKFEIIHEDTEDNMFRETRNNDGFTAYELLGILERVQMDIIAQMRGIIKPDIVKRNVIED